MFKKFLMLTFSFILILGFTGNMASAEKKFNTNELKNYKNELTDLDEEEVNEKFKEINEKYGMEEEFSKKDQAFIEMYAKPVEEDSHKVTPFKSKNVSNYKKVAGIQVEVAGTLNVDIQNIAKQSYGASNLKTRTTSGASKVKSVTTKVHHQAYGAVGSGGVGKVYTGSITGTGKNHDINSTKSYTANVVYANTFVETTVKYNGGTFTVN